MTKIIEMLVALVSPGTHTARDSGWSDRFLPPALCDARCDRGRTNPVRDFRW